MQPIPSSSTMPARPAHFRVPYWVQLRIHEGPRIVAESNEANFTGDMHRERQHAESEHDPRAQTDGAWTALPPDRHRGDQVPRSDGAPAGQRRRSRNNVGRSHDADIHRFDPARATVLRLRHHLHDGEHRHRERRTVPTFKKFIRVEAGGVARRLESALSLAAGGTQKSSARKRTCRRGIHPLSLDIDDGNAIAESNEKSTMNSR